MALERLETRAVLSAAFGQVGITSLRNDPAFGQIDGQGPDGRKIGVAILDTGVFGNHPDLRSNFIAYYDAVTRSSVTTNPAGSRDPEGHGTHVSGTAVSSNPAYGVATKGGLIGVRVLAAPGERLPAHDPIAEGLRWVAQVHQQYNIRVVNMSLGSMNFNVSAAPQGGATIASAIRVLERLGITVITAAGNSWAQYQQEGSAFPGNVSTVSVVNTWATNFTATSPQDALVRRQGGGGRQDTYLAVDLSAVPDQLAATSQRSGALSSQLAAPGTNITSTSSKGGTESNSGTSMASPLVAGVVALMQDAAQTFGGRWLTPTEVHSILRSSADTIVDASTNGNGRFPRSALADRFLSWGEVSPLAETGKSFPRVNAHRAVQTVRTLLGGGSIPVTGQDLNGTMATAVMVPDLDGTRVFRALGSIGRDGNTSVGSNDVDLVKIQLVTSGSISIRIDPDPNGRSFDPYLRLFNASGQQIAAVNNTNGNYPALQSVALQPGTYYAGISSFNNSAYGVVSATGRTGGGSEGEYAFTLTLENPDANGVIQGAAPANDWLGLPGADSGYFWSYGEIGSDPAPVDGNPRVPIGLGDVDMFEVVAPDDGLLRIAVYAARGFLLPNSNPFDAFLRVFGANGTLLASADNTFNVTDPSIEIPVVRGQQLFVGVSTNFNTSYSATEPYGRPSVGGTGTYEIAHWFSVNDADGTAWAVLSPTPFNSTLWREIGWDLGSQVGRDGTKDVDFFPYVPQQSGMLDVSVVGQSGFVPAVTVWKWDPVQQNVVRLGERVAASVNHRVAVQAGEVYYVSVTGNGNAGYQWFATASGSGGATGSYTITASVQSSSAVWQVQDDTFQGAALGVLGVDDVRFGELGADDTLYRGTTDVDLYRFQPQSSGRVAFAASGDALFGASPVLRLFDAGGNEVAFSTSSAQGLKGSSLEFDVVAGQTYYVGVSGWADSGDLRGYQPQGTLSTVSGSAGTYVLSATTVLTFTPGGVTIGTVEFGSIPAGYALRVGGSSGQVIPVTYQGGNASASFPGGGWQGLGGRQAGAGYQFLWRNPSLGLFAGWSLDASGAFVGGSLLSAAQIRGVETEVNKDIDGDGSIGVVFTPGGVTIGAVEFGTVAGEYALRVGGSNGQVIPVTYQGVVTSAAFPGSGWQGLGGRQAGAGYQFLWRNTSLGLFAGWSLDASGAFVGGSLLSAAQIRFIEVEVNTDIDGNGSVATFAPSGVTIGTVEFGAVSGAYALRVGGSSGQVVPVTYQGGNASASFPGGGWQGLGGRQAGAGYQFLWRNASLGLFAGWSLDASGAFVGGSLLSAAQIRFIEIEVNKDIDGNSSVATFAPGGVTIGTVEFGAVSGAYALRVGGSSGQVIPVTYQGGNASASFPGGGWQGLGGRQAGAGYQFLWRNASLGLFAGWSLDASGAFVGGSLLSAAQIRGIETEVGMDIDGDGSIGVVFTPSGVNIDTVEFGTVVGEYALRVGGSNGQVIPVTYQGVVTSAAFPGSGWQGLGGRQAGAGYQFLWRNASLGLFAGWSLDASGAFVGGSLLSAAQIRGIETEVGMDIDGDGSIGVVFTPSGVNIDTVEFGTVVGEYWLRVGGSNGQVIPVTYGGKNASPSNPGGGWQAVGARTAEEGGYELLWVNRANARPGAVYGTFGAWALGSTGSLSTARSVSLSEILGLESDTGIDIDGNGLVGPSTNVKLGAMGDSLIDEHFDQGIGYSRNWYEIMVDAGQINGGRLGSDQPGGDWGDDRGTGYEFNVALAGATTSTLVDRGQHTTLGQLALAKGISHAVIIVGANDFFPAPPGSGSAYEAIYNGMASQQMIASFVNEAIADWTTAVTALKTAGVKVVGSTIPDYGIAPYTRERYPDAAKRERVTSVIRQINATTLRAAASNLGVPLVDIFTLTRDIWGPNGSERQSFNLGGVALQLAERATDRHSDTPAAFADDGIHPMNTIGGVFANVIMDALNTHYGTSFQLFTEQEILGRAGMILAGGYDGTKLETVLGKPLSSYVLAPIRTG